MAFARGARWSSGPFLWSRQIPGAVSMELKVTSAPKKFRHRFRASADLKLLVNPTDIGVNRFVTNPQLLGDFFVDEALAEAIKHFLFTLGEVLGRLSRRPCALKGLGHFPRDMSRH